MNRLRTAAWTLLAILLASTLLAPTALAQTAPVGYTTTIQVTDQNKHSAPTDSDITFVHYNFAYSGNAPNPEAPLEGDRVATAWVLLNVDHQYHNGQFFIRDAEEENTIVYKVIFNGMTIEYRTHLHVVDSGWNLIGAFQNGMTGRGRVTVEYKVYNETGVLVADERDEEIIGYLQPGSIPDSRLWISTRTTRSPSRPTSPPTACSPDTSSRTRPTRPGECRSSTSPTRASRSSSSRPRPWRT